MTQIIEVDESGALRVPPEAVGHVKPRTRYVVQRQGQSLVLSPADRIRLPRQSRTPQERAEAIREWADRSRPPVPPVPLNSMRRENLYD